MMRLNCRYFYEAFIYRYFCKVEENDENVHIEGTCFKGDNIRN